MEPLVYITMAVSCGFGGMPDLLDSSPRRITSLYGRTLTASSKHLNGSGFRASSITI